MNPDEIIQYAFAAGRYAANLESFNRDAQELLNDIREITEHRPQHTESGASIPQFIERTKARVPGTEAERG